MSAITLESGELAYEHEGLLWKPLEGSVSNFTEFIRARERWLEIFYETQWNPWRTEELQEEADHANDIMRAWTRAEPDHRMMTEDEVNAWMAEMDREFKSRRASDEARWERDKKRYAPEREKARYALLEREAMRTRMARDLEGLRSGEHFPGMQPEFRVKRIAELESDREVNEREISKLPVVVGDPEDVVDIAGTLPRDRRPLHRVGYDVYRRFTVEELHASVSAQHKKIAATKDRKQKSELERSLRTMERKLTELLAVPRLTPEDVCSECDTPQYQHVSGGDASKPCPRSPMYAARMERVWENLRLVSERLKPAEPVLPKPAPLATLPGNLPIAQVIERLSQLQRQHPDAVVKRGRANRWELWPTPVRP